MPAYLLHYFTYDFTDSSQYRVIISSTDRIRKQKLELSYSFIPKSDSGNRPLLGTVIRRAGDPGLT